MTVSERSTNSAVSISAVAVPPQVAMRVSGLNVTARTTGRAVLDDISVAVSPGLVTGIVGESGSGKTTLLRSLLGAVAPGLDASGRVELVDGESATELLGASSRRLRSIRSHRIAYLSQDPGRSLTPTMRIAAAIGERLPSGLGRETRQAAVRELLSSVGLPSDDDFLRRYPFALSGGQAQRVALARALATSPDVLLLDEPTTGLDVVTQADLLDELKRQHEATPRTTVIVSHDLAVIAQLADHVVVLRHGEVVESGPCVETLRRPSHLYTRQLVELCPDPLGPQLDRRIGDAASADPSDPELRVRGLVATHRRPRRAPVVAADGLDLDLHAGRCVALVGTSGSGKSTIARAIVGAHRPDSGEITVDGTALSPDLDGRSSADRWRVQMVPQDPTSSLDPRRRVGRAVGDVVRRVGSVSAGDDVDAAVARLFIQVDLDPSLMERRPGALSGGERQRVAIARALAASPSVLLCDEVTSALDVSVQADVVRLLRTLVDEQQLAMLFITHDLGLVHDIADEVAVLHEGSVCEIGPVDAVARSPEHPVTQRLLAASPSLAKELEHAEQAASITP